MKFLKRFKSFDHSEKFNIIALLLMIFLAFIAALFSFMDFGFFSFTNSQALGAVLVILGVMASSQVMEKYGILQDIKNNIANLKDANVMLSSRKQIENDHSLDERFGNADRVRIAALASVGLWTSTPFDAIRRAVKNNHTKFDFISLDPQSDLVQEVMHNKIESDDYDLIERPLRLYAEACQKDPDFAEKVSYQVCEINFPYALMLVDKSDGTKLLKIDLYDYSVSDSQRRSLFIALDDADPLYKFYDEQWNKYVQVAHPYHKGA